jgi:hypothetical protein
MIFQMSIKSLRGKVDKLRFDLDWKDRKMSVGSQLDKSGELLNIDQVNAELISPMPKRNIDSDSSNEGVFEDQQDAKSDNKNKKRGDFFKCSSIGKTLRLLTSCLCCTGR